MIVDLKKYELFGLPLLQKIVIKPPFKTELPISDEACFLYIIEGNANSQINKNRSNLKSKDAILLDCSNFKSNLSFQSSAQKNEIIIIHFHPEVLKKVFESDLPTILQHPIEKIKNEVEAVDVNNDFLIQKYIEGLLFYFDNPTLVNEDILVLKLKEILLLMSQTKNALLIQQILSQLFSPQAFEFKQLIEKNIFTDITTEKLAELANMSVSSFKRIFSKLYNDTPAAYIRNKKLEKAAELLLISDERISDIAFNCGFNDATNFSKIFYEKHHVTPTNFRLNQKNE